MRKLIASVVATVALLVTGTASAATVDLFLTQQSAGGVGTNDWVLTANVNNGGLGAVAVQITSGGTGSFVIAQTNVVIDPCIANGGFSFCSNAPGLTRLGLGPGTQGFMVNAPTAGFVIGTFTGTGTVQLLEANLLEGDTALDENFEPVSFTVNTVPVAPPVPEPVSMLLLGLGLGGISLARRKSA